MDNEQQRVPENLRKEASLKKMGHINGLGILQILIAQDIS